jgi:tetratricopeptide (TPR) repeat protein
MCFAPEDVERMLLHGVYASRQIQDRSSTICFLNRLGIQFVNRGDIPRAQRVFEESAQIAESLNQPLPERLWISLSFLAHLAHIQGELEVAQRYIETYLHHLQQIGDPYSILQGLQLRAFYRRVAGDTDRAYNDLSEGMYLLSQHIPVNSASKNDFLEIQLQMEMARVQGDYQRSNTFNEAAVALFQGWDDDYMVADLLFDQADYAFRLGKRDDAHAHILRAIDAATKAGAQTHRQRSIALLHKLSDDPPHLILS